MVTGPGGENAALAMAPKARLDRHLSCISGSDGRAHEVERGPARRRSDWSCCPPATVAHRRQFRRRSDAVNGAERELWTCPEHGRSSTGWWFRSEEHTSELQSLMRI